MKLRQYQLDIANSVLQSSTKDLIQLATGGGKTVIAGHICNIYLNDKKKVLFLAHREELIRQPKEKFYSQFGIESSIIKASEFSDLTVNLQIASIQTFQKRLNFEPDVIIIDEAHHSEASTYQKVINAYPNAKLIGLTATPYRLSGKGFADTFDRLVISKSIKDLEQEGFLVPAKCFSYPIGHDKLSRIKITGGDYNEQELETVMNDRVLIEDIVVSYEKHAKDKKMIVFASSVKHSQLICQRFKQFGFNALHIDAKTKNRSEIIDDFRFGKTGILCNVGIATEGLDIPEIEAVCLARPTKSLALYLQMCGRGSRPFEGKKEYLLLDHSDNYLYEHGAPNKKHDWQLYFKGMTKKQLENISNKKKVFKLIIDNEELLIDNILDIPANVRGFALEEIYFTSSQYYDFFLKSEVEKELELLQFNKDEFCKMIGIDIDSNEYKELPDICQYETISKYYSNRHDYIETVGQFNIISLISFNKFSSVLYGKNYCLVLDKLIAPIQILYNFMSNCQISNNEDEDWYWCDFTDMIKDYINNISSYSLNPDRKEFIEKVLCDYDFISLVAREFLYESKLKKFSTINIYRKGVNLKINLCGWHYKKLKKNREKDAVNIVKSKLFHDFVSNVLNGDINKFNDYMKSNIKLNETTNSDL